MGPCAPEALRRSLKSVRGIDRFYLAGGTAIAVHLRHRVSNDLEVFGPKRASFAPFQALAKPRSNDVKVVTVGDATLHMEIGGVPVDVVRYPYPLLEEPRSGTVPQNETTKSRSLDFVSSDSLVPKGRNRRAKPLSAARPSQTRFR